MRKQQNHFHYANTTKVTKASLLKGRIIAFSQKINNNNWGISYEV